MDKIHPFYPTPEDVDDWCEALITKSHRRELTVKHLDDPSYDFQLGVRHTDGNHYVAFETEGQPTFYGYWQPATSGPAPILFHLPGYGAEMSAHPELVQAGFNVLHINPRGYATPNGPSRAEMAWPVLPDTVESKGKAGYVNWLEDVASAMSWALSLDIVEPKRFGFFGSSQGGGTSLLMASIFSGMGVRAVAADVPFLTNFPLMFEQEDHGAYAGTFNQVKTSTGMEEEWRALGFIDTISHARRLKMPVLLTAGSLDTATPPVSVSSLFDLLPGTRSYTFMEGVGHRYTTPFLRLAKAWFQLYV
jgi:cephalosporin-C deacetylase-like acetyl esterase